MENSNGYHTNGHVAMVDGDGVMALAAFDPVPIETLEEVTMDVGLMQPFDTMLGPIHMPVGVIKKMALVMADIENLAKDGTNSFHKYDFLSAGNVANTLRPIFAKHGLVIIPHVFSVDQTSDMTYMELRFIVADADTGDAFIVRWKAEANDKGDKGINKAYTIGKKYFIMSMLGIAGVDDDPDGQPGNGIDKRTSQGNGRGPGQRPPQPQAPAMCTQEQALEMESMGKQIYGEDGWPAQRTALLDAAVGKSGARYGELTAAQYNDLKKQLAGKLAQAGAEGQQ